MYAGVTMKSFLIWVGIVLVLLGSREYGEGDVYVLNNVGRASNLPHGGGALEDLYVAVEWEGERIKIQPNMDEDKNSTGIGAVRITAEPLEGGVVVDFAYGFMYYGDEMQRKLSGVMEEEALVDGDITIELYTEYWIPGSYSVIVLAEVHKGKYDGIHFY
jgi:hypothetical protein